MNYQANGVLQDNMQQDTIDAFVNLASATTDDRNTGANLTAANFTLSSQIKALNEHNKQQKEEMDNLKTSVSDILSLLQDTNLWHNGNGNGNRNNCPEGNTA
eukprot:12909127-Ditylum_brightwellii.AAC.1